MDTYLTESNLTSKIYRLIKIYIKTLYCDAPLEIKRYTYFNLQMHIKNAFLRDYEKETRILRCYGKRVSSEKEKGWETL